VPNDLVRSVTPSSSTVAQEPDPDVARAPSLRTRATCRACSARDACLAHRGCTRAQAEGCQRWFCSNCDIGTGCGSKAAAEKRSLKTMVEDAPTTGDRSEGTCTEVADASQSAARRSA